MQWDEMLEAFRALGGVADNVEMREGRFGRGLFARDPKKPVRLFVPAAMMFNIEEVELTENGLRLGGDVKASEAMRSFWDGYQRDFGWGPGHEHAKQLLALMKDAPAELRALLDKPFNLDLWLEEPTRKAILERYLITRTIGYDGTQRIMPVIELANHGHGHHYEFKGGTSLSGLFPEGEVLSEYRLSDPWGMFKRWGFASGSEDFALSLNMGLETKWGMLRIENEDVESRPDRTPFLPRVHTMGRTTIKLSYMLLGHKKYPRLARGIFTKIMRDNGHVESDELFDRIQHVNRMQFYKLIAASEEAAPALGRMLRDAARHQLEAMSWNMGARPL